LPSKKFFRLFSLLWKSFVSFRLDRESFVFPIGSQAITTEITETWRRP